MCMYTYILSNKNQQYIYVCVCTLIAGNPPPRGGFLFTMFPDQESCLRDFTTRCDRRISS